uniref:Exonuclease domain-containing protein n=1 Tax=Steinernema glaseri TaxID=37863 RepID=A0A1I8AMS7_9BILA
MSKTSLIDGRSAWNSSLCYRLISPSSWPSWIRIDRGQRRRLPKHVILRVFCRLLAFATPRRVARSSAPLPCFCAETAIMEGRALCPLEGVPARVTVDLETTGKVDGALISRGPTISRLFPVANFTGSSTAYEIYMLIANAQTQSKTVSWD